MHRTILLSAVPAVSAMISWSPEGLHLPTSLSSLLHPLSSIDSESSSLPPAQALAPSEEQDNDSDSVVVVINPSLSALFSELSKTHPTPEDEDVRTTIEDAHVDFVSPFLPPPPTRAKGDTEAPISSQTTVPEVYDDAALGIITDTVDDTGYPAEDVISITASGSRKAIMLIPEEGIALAEIEPMTVEADGADDDHLARQHTEHTETTLQKQLDCLKEKIRALHRQSTTYLLPTSSFQWIIFALSFSATLLIIGGKVLLAQRRRRRNAGSDEQQAKHFCWEKLSVAGVEVGMVKRRVLRRGECVWVVVPSENGATGGERMEKVWLEDGVGVRGEEVWNQSMV